MLPSHLFWTSNFLWTHQPGSRTGGRSHPGFLQFPSAVLALVFSRERFSHLFPSSTVESNFVYPRTNRSPHVGHDFLFFYFFILLRKNASSCDCTEKTRTQVPTSEGFEVTTCTTEATGRMYVWSSRRNSRSCQLMIDYLIEEDEVRNGVQKEQKYLYFEMFYGGQKLHKYFRSLLIKDTSLLTC